MVDWSDAERERFLTTLASEVAQDDDSPEDVAERVAAAARGVSRREVLAGGGALGLGALLGGGGASALTGDAKAAASDTDSDGDFGTPDNPEDFFADGLAVFDGANNQVGSFDGTGIETPSVNTPELVNAWDYIIRPTDDLQSIINNGNTGDSFLLSTDGTWTIDAPLNPPQAATIWCNTYSGPGAGAVIEKGFNGAMSTSWPSDVRLHGVVFLGNKATYSGDGIQTAENMSNNYWTDVKISDVAGDCFVPDKHFFNLFQHFKFQNAGGYGMRVIDTGSTGHVSQNVYGGQSIVANNGMGGVKYEVDNNFVHTENYHSVTISQSGGPAFYAKVSTMPNLSFYGSIVESDGPAFLFEDSTDGNRARFAGTSIKANFDSNNKDFANVSQVQSPASRDSGLIHLQSDDSEFVNVYLTGLELQGRINSPNSDHIIASYDQTKVTGDIGLGGTGGIPSAIRMSAQESKITISSDGPYSVKNAPSDGVALAIGEDYIEDVVTGGKVYLGARNSTPHAASGTGDVYIDTSTNPPSWKCDDPADSAWETM